MTFQLLIVDDDEDIQLILKSMLSRFSNVTVQSAGDGKTARDMLLNSTIDGVILDYLLPDATGAELIRWIQEADLVRAPQMIMLSARDDLELREQWLDLGVKAVYKKPFNPLELVKDIREQFEI